MLSKKSRDNGRYHVLELQNRVDSFSLECVLILKLLCAFFFNGGEWFIKQQGPRIKTLLPLDFCDDRQAGLSGLDCKTVLFNLEINLLTGSGQVDPQFASHFSSLRVEQQKAAHLHNKPQASCGRQKVQLEIHHTLRCFYMRGSCKVIL